MLAFVIVLQVLVALFLIGVVLLQPGNRGGASAALGGAGADTVFGGRGANTFLAKLTFGAAVCFMVTNILLSMLSSSTMGNKSVLDALEKTAPTKTEAPAAKENAPAAGAGNAPAGEAPKEGTDTVAPPEQNAAPNEEEAPKE